METQSFAAAVLLHGPLPGAAQGLGGALDAAADLLVGIILAALAGAYALGSWRRWARARGRERSFPSLSRMAAYAAGMAALALALLGPPDRLNTTSFTAHMAQHLLLTLVAPPLLLLGEPGRAALALASPGWWRARLRALRPHPWVRRAAGLLLVPLVAAVLVNGALVLWHLPTLYAAAVRSPLVHGFEHGSLFWTALLFWWLVIAPAPRLRRPDPGGVLLMIFATWMVSDLLGATLTLANDVLYADYAGAAAPAAALADQRRGGILMWAGGGGLYALCLLGLLIRTYSRQRTAARADQAALRGGEDVRPSTGPA